MNWWKDPVRWWYEDGLLPGLIGGLIFILFLFCVSYLIPHFM